MYVYIYIYVYNFSLEKQVYDSTSFKMYLLPFDFDITASPCHESDPKKHWPALAESKSKPSVTEG